MRAALATSLWARTVSRSSICRSLSRPGEVVVRVRAAALNFLDTLITHGKYQFKTELPFLRADPVVTRGDGVTDRAVGQSVYGASGREGAREAVAVRSDFMVSRPDAIPDDVAAGVSVTFGTAMYGRVDRVHLKPGGTVASTGWLRKAS